MGNLHVEGPNVGVDSRYTTQSQRYFTRLLHRAAKLRTVADALPITVIKTIVTNGKTASAAFLGLYLAFVALWIPFKLLALVISELGVYALTICGIFFIGRNIIRLIAFPGASQKVTQEIEREFAKYSVRMITLACQSILEVTQTIAAKSSSSSNNAATIRRSNSNLSDLASTWNRAKSYRDRVLGVYLEVLLYLYNQPSLPTDHAAADLTRFGNNRLAGDVGTLERLTAEAKTDGRELMERLKHVILLLDNLEEAAQPILDSNASRNRNTALTEEAYSTAALMGQAVTDLKDFMQSLKPISGAMDDDSDDEDEENTDLSMDSMRRKLEDQSNTVDMVRNSLASLLPMIDPPPHTSIFGFDVQRGCMMSRYRGSRQLWVRRPRGGMLDVIHFPARREGEQTMNNARAVLYCNPNAGLVEVAAGLSLIGGNIPSVTTDPTTENSWVDYYTSLGLDVYVFNYAGYGRSFGATLCSSSLDTAYHPGVCSRIYRIFRSTFLSFTPSPHSLRADAKAVGKYLILDLGVEELIIHGESIGGMAAAGAGNELSHSPETNDKLSLLICDRTFCNLEAVAQRLVGGWSGYAIRCLAPFWSTDVAGDFIATACPKVVANDSADSIISDAASLKSGIALWKEIHRGVATTKGIGWITEEPLQYRMADFENCCVNESKYLAGQSLFRVKFPVWPVDKHVSVEEVFHFAACCKRIGKVSKEYRNNSGNPGQSIEFSLALGPLTASQPLVCEAWKVIACCDGLTGMPLGMSVKQGFDATVSWLCACLVFGPQRVVALSESRLARIKGNGSNQIEAVDFDARPPGFESEENDMLVHPQPIPEVVGTLISILETGDNSLSKRTLTKWNALRRRIFVSHGFTFSFPVSHEFQYVLGTLQYLQARVSSAASIDLARKIRGLEPSTDSSVGCFMNLHCGHNNPFSNEEKQDLKALLERASAVHQNASSLQLSVV